MEKTCCGGKEERGGETNPHIFSSCFAWELKGSKTFAVDSNPGASLALPIWVCYSYYCI